MTNTSKHPVQEVGQQVCSIWTGGRKRQTITHNKSRSVLTAFGVFWGMFMFVAAVGAGQALENGMMSGTKGLPQTPAL